MIELPIPESIVIEARRMADEMGEIDGTFTDPDGKVAGFIGELMTAEYLNAEQTNTYEYDLTYNGVLLEVKTKRCSSEPLPNYDCDVSGRNIRQKADFYVFTRVMKDFSKCWLLGCVGKFEFVTTARFHERGSKSYTGFQYTASCFSVPVSSLKPFEELLIASKCKQANLAAGSPYVSHSEPTNSLSC